MKPSMAALFAVLLASALSAKADGSLCEKNEVTVWSCHTKEKTYSLCASHGINATSGYMQYRAGRAGHIDFRFPKGLKRPKDLFTAGIGNRSGYFQFRNGNYQYEITDQLIGQTSIRVKKNGRFVTEILCSHAEPSILDNASIDLLNSAGLLSK